MPRAPCCRRRQPWRTAGNSSRRQTSQSIFASCLLSSRPIPPVLRGVRSACDSVGRKNNWHPKLNARRLQRQRTRLQTIAASRVRKQQARSTQTLAKHDEFQRHRGNPPRSPRARRGCVARRRGRGQPHRQPEDGNRQRCGSVGDEDCSATSLAWSFPGERIATNRDLPSYAAAHFTPGLTS